MTTIAQTYSAGNSEEPRNDCERSGLAGIMQWMGWRGVAICNTRGNSRLALAPAQPPA
jgi:hypothetical protein